MPDEERTDNPAIYCPGLDIPHQWKLSELAASCLRCGMVLPPWKSELKHKSVKGKRAPKRDKWIK